MDKNLAFYGVLFLFLSVIGFGQNERIMMANLKQDLELINREVTGLRSEVELLRRENAQLRVALEQVSRTPQSNQETGLVLELQNRMQLLELALKQSERARESMQDGVNQKFKQMIEQMNLGFEQVTSQNKQKSAPPAIKLSNPRPNLRTGAFIKPSSLLRYK